MKRKPELSWLNVLFFLQVIWIHCSSHPVTVLKHGSWQYLLIFMLQRLSFVSVYGFFFLSGLKLMLPRRREPSTLEYWRARVKSLLLPYLVAVLLYYLWFTFYLHYFPFSWLDYLHYAATGTLSAPFYFLIALFQFVLLAPIIRYALRRWHPCLILVFSMGITWFSSQHFAQVLEILRPGTSFPYTDRIFLNYLFYYIAGCCAGMHYDTFLHILNTSRGLITGLFLFFTLSSIVFTCLWASGLRQVPFLDELHFLYLISAILFCFMLAVRIRVKMPKWLAAVERTSFLIYLYHSLAISCYDSRVVPALFPNGRVSTLFLGRVLFVYTTCLLFSLLYQKISGVLARKLTPGSRS